MKGLNFSLLPLYRHSKLCNKDKEISFAIFNPGNHHKVGSKSKELR